MSSNALDDGSVQFQVVRNKNLHRRIAEVLERLNDFPANPSSCRASMRKSQIVS